MPALRGSIEKKFLWRLLLGESVAPLRLLDAAEAVIPWDEKAKSLLEAKAARERGYSGLGDWLSEGEALWGEQGAKKLSLVERIDKFHALTIQMPPAKLRVVYSASGTIAAATIVADEHAVVEHKLYWCAIDSIEEARFITGVLNSEATRKAVEDLQSRGQWGPRDFDKLLAEAIPQFDAENERHQEVAELARRGEEVAAGVELPERMHFVRARRMLREALRQDGVAGKIDRVVAALLRKSD